MIEIFTDGACKGNPGPGGWGVLVRANGIETTNYGFEEHTTNNRMELTAAIKALEDIHFSSIIHIYTDSKYLCQGINEWIIKWKKNNWRNSKKELVKNVDLWQQLDLLNSRYQITWHWVKGHAGHRENDMADALANKAVAELCAK